MNNKIYITHEKPDTPKPKGPVINKYKEKLTCTNCKYREKYEYGHFKCIKNDFALNNAEDTVCDFLEENEIYKKKKECNFRRV